jgi:hypothetical protein
MSGDRLALGVQAEAGPPPLLVGGDTVTTTNTVKVGDEAEVRHAGEVGVAGTAAGGRPRG